MQLSRNHVNRLGEGVTNVTCKTMVRRGIGDENQENLHDLVYGHCSAHLLWSISHERMAPSRLLLSTGRKMKFLFPRPRRMAESLIAPQALLGGQN
jgi:hypothetical protein